MDVNAYGNAVVTSFQLQCLYYFKRTKLQNAKMSENQVKLRFHLCVIRMRMMNANDKCE